MNDIHALLDNFENAAVEVRVQETLCRIEARIIADALADGIADRHVEAYVERYKRLRDRLAEALLAENAARTKLEDHRAKETAESKK
ncbi:hypothetical protein CGQ24_08325 [Arthrobacter sp. 7749]|nr:hypothetical protein CGQ24_08325 [Arthrobacter sp. 7749]